LLHHGAMPSYIPPAPREVAHTNDLWLSLCVAVALGLAAVTIALWPSPRRAEAATHTDTPVLSPDAPLSSADPRAAPSKDSPTRFANPFDTSEVFEFPAGTTQDDARQLVAEILVERARERGAQTRTVKRVQTSPSTPLRLPRLMSKNIFENAS